MWYCDNMSDIDNENSIWLKSLKVGDDVAVRYSSFGSKSYSFGKIEKITPKGAIRVSTNKDLLFKDGNANSSSSKWNSSWYTLIPITEELLTMLDNKKKLDTVASFKAWNTLGSPIINQVYDIIKDYRGVK